MQSKNKSKKDHVTKTHKKDNIEIAKDLNLQKDANLIGENITKNSQNTACANPSRKKR